MKKVLFLFDKKNPLKDNSKDYEDLYSYLFTHKIAAYRSPVSHYNKTLGLFNQASFFEKKTGWLIKKNLKPALIFDKTPFF